MPAAAPFPGDPIMTETLWLQITSARGPAGANTSSPACCRSYKPKRRPLASALSSSRRKTAMKAARCARRCWP